MEWLFLGVLVGLTLALVARVRSRSAPYEVVIRLDLETVDLANLTTSIYLRLISCSQYVPRLNTLWSGAYSEPVYIEPRRIFREIRAQGYELHINVPHENKEFKCFFALRYCDFWSNRLTMELCPADGIQMIIEGSRIVIQAIEETSRSESS